MLSFPLACLVSSIAALPFCFLLLLLRPKPSLPGPKHWPLLGSTLELISSFHYHHDWLALYAQRFTTFQAYVFGQRVIYTTSPANVEHVVKTNFSNYIKGPSAHDILYEFLGNGIFNSDGELWKQQRTTASYEFVSKNLREHSRQIFLLYALRLADILAVASKENRVVDLNDLFMRLAFDSICHIGFGTEAGTLAESLPEVPYFASFDRCLMACFKRCFDVTWKLKRYFNIGREAKLKQDIILLDKVTRSLLLNRRTDTDKTGKEEKINLLSRFLTFSKQDPNFSIDKRLRDTIVNFTIAGRDTTATTLSWLFFLLLKHPEVEVKLLREILSVEQRSNGGKEKLFSDHVCEQSLCSACFKKFANLLTFEAVNNMHYLHAALSETLRLYPPVPINVKVAVKEDVLPDGTQLKPTDEIFILPYAMGRMESLWGTDALDFKPERWLKEGVFQPESPFKFTAFHAGPRVCLGKESAYLQMKIASAIILRFFKFAAAPGQLDEVKYTMALILLISPGTLNVMIQPRRFDGNSSY